MQTRKCHANANANADPNRIRTKNNMSPSPSVADIIITVKLIYYKVNTLCNQRKKHNFSSSWCQELAATSACGSSWTFLFTFFVLNDKKKNKEKRRMSMFLLCNPEAENSLKKACMDALWLSFSN